LPIVVKMLDMFANVAGMCRRKRMLLIKSIIILCMASNATFGQVIAEDSLALVALYNSMDGPNWFRKNNWLVGPVGTWFGVSISRDRVWALDLSGNGLKGTIPDEFWNLSGLRILDLSLNSIRGTISPKIQNLTSLRDLFLRSNLLEGSIPPELGKLKNLRTLDLSLNRLSGTLPQELSNLTNLRVLYLHGNKLSGEIPKWIGKFSQLRRLDLSNNEFEGQLSKEIFDLPYLQDFSIGGNNLYGAIPSSINGLYRLMAISIEGNAFDDLPSLKNLSNLEYLLIQNNKFTFEDIEPNIGVAKKAFIYWPQDSVGTRIDTTVNVGDKLVLQIRIGGRHNIYRWKKDGKTLPFGEDSVLVLNDIDFPDSGTYWCEITNSLAPKLTLYSRPIRVRVQLAPIFVRVDDEMEEAAPGTLVQYKVAFANQSDQYLSKCVIFDTIPDFVDLISVSASDYKRLSENVLSWTVDRLNPGEVREESVKVQIWDEDHFPGETVILRHRVKIVCQEGFMDYDEDETVVRGVPLEVGVNVDPRIMYLGETLRIECFWNRSLTEGTVSIFPEGDRFVFIPGLSKRDTTFMYTPNQEGDHRVIFSGVDLAGGVSEAEVIFQVIAVEGLLLNRNMINLSRGESVILKIRQKKDQRVKVGVYNVSGEKVCDVYDGVVEKAEVAVEWDGRDTAGKFLNSGLYLVLMETEDGRNWVRKLLIVK